MAPVSTPTRKVRVWDLPVRVFHWSLVVAFAVAYFGAESERQRLLHVYVGYFALALVALRLLWGFIGSRYARFSSFAFSPAAALQYLKQLLQRKAPNYVGHNPAGSYAIYAILLLAIATGITGWMNYNEIGGETAEDLHELFANTWLLVVGVHILGVIAGSYAHKENLVRAMITGDKDLPASNRDASAEVAIAPEEAPLHH